MPSKYLDWGLWAALGFCLIAYHFTNIWVDPLPANPQAIVKVIQFTSFGATVLLLMDPRDVGASMHLLQEHHAEAHANARDSLEHGR